MLGLREDEAGKTIAIFDDEHPSQPVEYEYNNNLDGLPLEVINTIQVLHEATQVTLRRQKLQEKSPILKKNSSPLKGTRKALAEKA